MAAHHVEQGILQIGGVTHSSVTYNNNNTPAPQRRTLLEALEFQSLEYREHTVELAQSGTCEWLLSSEEYRRWAKSGESRGHQNRLLWIKGKPGAGKSTIMKFAIRNARSARGVESGVVASSKTRSPIKYLRLKLQKPSGKILDELILSHFFNARGNPLEKSAEGMYRTLLVQLLKRNPHLPDLLSLSTTYWIPPREVPWPIPNLIEILKNVIATLDGQPLTIYVDALDECNRSEVQSMVHNFESIIEDAASRKQVLRVCFASRPYPDVVSPGAMYLDLGTVKDHIDDIVKYVDTHLRLGNSLWARNTHQKLLEKSHGSFIWVKLMVKTLNEEFSAGRLKECEELLDNNPGELEALYAEVLERGTETEDASAKKKRTAETVLCFQWMLFAEPRPTLFELWWVIQFGLMEQDSQQLPDWRARDKHCLKRYLTSISHGLLEVAKVNVHDPNSDPDPDPDNDEYWGDKRVQFIHESAREFMLSDVGLVKMLEAADRTEVKLKSYEQLKNVCWKVMLEFYAHVPERYSLTTSGIRSFLASVSIPGGVLETAFSSILRLADMIQRCQRDEQDQGSWLADFYNEFGKRDEAWARWAWVTWHESVPEGWFGGPIENMAFHGWTSLMRSNFPLLLRDIRNSRRNYYAPGVRGIVSHLAMVGGSKQRRSVGETIRCLVDLYKQQLDEEPREDEVQAFLEHLAMAWKINVYYPGAVIRRHPELMLADFSDGLAVFFLIALVPSNGFGNTDIDKLRGHAAAGFASTVNFFLKEQIPTSLADMKNKRTIQKYMSWAEHHGHTELQITLRSLP